MNIDLIKRAQARVTRLQAALDDVLTGKLRSGIDASTAAGGTRVGFFKPDVAILREELALAKADLGRLQGDRASIRQAFYL